MILPMARSKSRRSAGAPPLGRTVADLRALAHPLRLRMMELFAESPKTTKQVAELLEQPPTRLYHHVAALERAGLLVLTERRQNRGAVEKWYTGVAQQIREGARQKGDAGRAARRAVAATALEQARQELLAIPFGAKEVALLTRLVVVASPSQIPKIRAWLIDSVQRLRTEFELDDESPGTSEDQWERWALTVAFAPVRPPAESKRRRPRK
jgi:DNA-binding transcriptional ArsR family regulator